jgi:hypothetical protein
MGTAWLNEVQNQNAKKISIGNQGVPNEEKIKKLSKYFYFPSPCKSMKLYGVEKLIWLSRKVNKYCQKLTGLSGFLDYIENSRDFQMGVKMA